MVREIPVPRNTALVVVPEEHTEKLRNKIMYKIVLYLLNMKHTQYSGKGNTSSVKRILDSSTWRTHRDIRK